MTTPTETRPTPPGATAVPLPPVRRRWAGLRPSPELLLALIVFVSLFLRLLWLTKPDNALIFDETYYVNAARVILKWPLPEGLPYADQPAGFDSNREHPPLGKLLIATSMSTFGDNPWGWRLPSVFFGVLSIPLLYAIARQVGASKAVGVLAAFIFAFDNLVFVHSRIATLDIFLVFFLLLGVYCYLAGQPLLAGVILVLATLCKIGGMYGVGAIILLEGLRLARSRLASGRWQIASLRPLLIMVVAYAVLFPWLLAALDAVWSSYKSPIAHIRFIFDYGFALARPDGPQGQESNPWQWLLNEVPMTYLRTDVQVLVNGQAQITRAVIFFRGAMNPYVIFIAPLAIAYAAYLAYTRRDDYSFLVLALFVATYAPFWPAAMIAHRISYLFYFLPTLPAVAMGAAQLMYAPQIPRIIRWGYIGAVLLGFYGYFPFRTIP